MDAGTFVIAVLTAAGAAAGPAAGAADGAFDATAAAPAARCVAASNEAGERDPRQPDDAVRVRSRGSGDLDRERSGTARSNAEALAERRADADADQRAQAGAGQRAQDDVDAAAEADLAAELDAGLGADLNVDLNAGQGADLNAGPGADLNAGPDAGRGADPDAGQGADLDAGLDARAGTGAGAADRTALIEEMAQELAAAVAGSSDPTARRLANALAAAGFEGEQVVDEAGASRGQPGSTSRSGGAGVAEDLNTRSGRVAAGRAVDAAVCDDRGSEQDLAGGARADDATGRRTGLADVLDPADSRDEPRAPAGSAGERGGSDIADVLESSSGAGRTAG